MSWQIVALLKILAGSLLAPFAFRLLGGVSLRERVYRITLQYVGAAALALLIALWFGGLSFAGEWWKITVVGTLVPFGVLFQWRAYALSLSRSAVFIAFSNIIPLALSAALLDEWRVFSGNGPLVGGLLLALLGLTLNARHEVLEGRQAEKRAAMPLTFCGNALAFTLVLGFAAFLLNYWAKTGVGAAQFLFAWYFGALAGSIVLFLSTGSLPRLSAQRIPAKEYVLIALAAFSIVVSMGLEFVSFQRVEQTVVLPIYALGDIIGPALLGLIVFHEWRRSLGLGFLYISLGLLGAVLMSVAR